MTKDRFQILDGLSYAVRGLVKHDGAHLSFQRPQGLHTFTVFAGKETLIAEAVRRQAGQDQGVKDR